MKSNWPYQLMFSRGPYLRIARHFLYWMGRVFMCFLIGIPFVHSVQLFELYSWSILFYNYSQDIILFDIPFTYFTCYILIPRFLLRERYSLFGIYLFLTFLLFSISFICYEYQHLNTTASVRNSPEIPFDLVFVIWKLKVFFTYTGVSLILFTSIKLFKIWYLKEKENQYLLRLNKDAKIEILKSKIHPHFLFNTLNTIYSSALFDKTKTKGMLKMLYNILHYMIHDCNTEYISLTKEINTLLDYINLEKERYGERLNLKIRQSGEFNVVKIAPLLLQPFVENAFKHGVAKSVSPSFIDIIVETLDDFLFFTISNNIDKANVKQNVGIGIENIKSRLNILFPDNYLLDINQMDDLFKVKLIVPLKRI